MGIIDRALAPVRRLFNAASPPPQVPGLSPIISAQVPRSESEAVRVANSREALFGRVSYAAGPSPDYASTYPADGISPEVIFACLRTADTGYPRLQAELYEQVIERDAHLRGVAKARIYEVSGKPWRIKAKDETPLAIALSKFTRACLDEIDSFDAAIEDLLWANGSGYAASEIIWKFNRVRFPGTDGKPVDLTALGPRELSWVHQKHFEFDMLTDQPYLVLSSNRAVLPANKFVFHTAGDTGRIERRGFMRPCMTLHAAKVWALRDWILEEQLFSVPQLTGSYPVDVEEYAANRTTMQRVLRDWGKGIPAWLPDEVKFNVTKAQSNGASGIQGAIIGFVNSEMSKLIQGETLTTEIGGQGAYAATETHADTRHAFIRADARKLATTLREQLIRPLIRLNAEKLATALGETPEAIMRSVPLLYWRIERETSPTQRAAIMLDFAKAGLEIDDVQIRDEFALDEPANGDGGLKHPDARLADAKATEAEAGAVKDKADAAKSEAEAGDDSTAGAPTGDAPSLTLTATDIATIVTVNEARASQGLPPLASADGDLTVAEFKAKHAGPIAEAAQAEAGKDPDEDPEPPKGGNPPTMRRFDAGNFKEEDHPRKGGKFAPKGSGDSGAKAKEKKAKAPAQSKAKEPSSAPADTDAPASADQIKPAASARMKSPKPFKLKVQRAPRVKPPADPNAPAKPPREYHRDHLGRFRTAPRPGENAGQLTLPEKLPTVTKDGKQTVDLAKLPGGGKGWKIRSTTNPEAGFKGRSFVMNSITDGLAEFLATPCGRPDIDGWHGDKRDGWTNGDVLQAVMGRDGGDSTIWKEIANSTDAKVTDLASAFAAVTPPRKTSVVMRKPKVGDKVIARDKSGNKITGWLGIPDPKTGAPTVLQSKDGDPVEVQAKSVARPHGGKDRSTRDFRDLRLDLLQEAHPAFAVLARPTWLDEHQQGEETANYYREQAAQYEAAKKSSDGEVDAEELPDYGGHATFRSFNSDGEPDDEVPF